MREKFCVLLRHERERLGLTQQEFADEAGVSRMSQVNYESGKRFPGEEYFTALREMGVDDFYLTFGYRADERFKEAYAARFLIPAIAQYLGLEENAFAQAQQEMTRLASIALEEHDSGLMDKAGSVYAADVLADSPLILESDLLGEVLKGVDLCLGMRGIALPPDKKARVVVMLYRSFKVSGDVNQNVIDDAIALAIA